MAAPAGARAARPATATTPQAQTQPSTTHQPSHAPSTQPRSPHASPHAATPTPPSTPASGGGPPGRTGSAPGHVRRGSTSSPPAAAQRPAARRAARTRARRAAPLPGRQTTRLRGGGAGAGAARTHPGRGGVRGRRATPASRGAAALAARRAAARTAQPPPAASSSGGPVDRLIERIPDWSRPIIALLIAVALVFWLRSLVASARTRRLERQTARLADDFGVMQAALVPDVPARLGALAASVAYRPADGPAAGGDFYDVFELPGGRVAVIVGDASGHGSDAVARATAVRFRLRAYLEIGFAPREALGAAGQVLALDSGDAAFATAVLAIYDPDESTLTYACAGHPPPILLGPGEHEPVGVWASPPIGWGFATGQRQTTVALGHGSVACFFTDGLVEARSDGRMVGRERLAEMVRGIDANAAGAAAAVIQRVRASAATAPDDMAALVLSVCSERTRPALRVEELEAEPADLRRGAAEALLDACDLQGDDVLRAMRIVALAGRAGRPVLVRAEIADGGVTVEALERLGDDARAPRFIPAASESRIEIARRAPGRTAAAAGPSVL